MSPQLGDTDTPIVSSTGHLKEYFVPRAGISRDVISADICLYLGNDALVRPGSHIDPLTGQSIQGYYISAYRCLTTAMIEDLKVDSARWEIEQGLQKLRNEPEGIQPSIKIVQTIARVARLMHQ